MTFILMIIIGGIMGWLASMVMGRDASMGILWNIIVGVVGAILGGWIGSLIGVGGGWGDFSISGLIMMFVGAVVLLAIANLIQRRRIR
ncbi:MAG: GlsB/YeaQ/YmgE family stress response membrane protein [Novosphingopyxis baekryungensis]|jgi:uncharacterized membrane protein YeaQ/YmgE (transglycosylase-associated protein family)|uniref:GlsB/YeaQ/YmgE family stress response membrane protein n=1 Tax=Novosphingopyxis baekryungensis TaxID=279369 RepID=UPI0004013B94|nr:GlsB/YeaQ/YmgE family stress response membrane protein [Novosphingopyxis baekryungensis]MDE0932263.1 GlsB/YeaQ/YmgE family stress response membrane protein [Novosphingopyxis baekryungensis]